MRIKPVIHMAAAFGLCAGIASAQSRADRFVERDRNGDGLLSPNEYQTTGGHPGNFRALDTNGDGMLTRSEFLGRDGAIENESYESVKVDPTPYPDDPNVWTKVEFRKRDVNRDDVLTKREWSGDERTFRRLDVNGDGYVSSAEFVAVAPLTGAIGGFGSGTMENAFAVKDRNRDGWLTRREYAHDQTFDRVDSNDDGRIGYEEFLNPPSADTAYAAQNAFQIKDRNRDGTLTRREYAHDQTFDRVDSNDDGRISYQEFLNPPAANSPQGRFDESDRNDDGTLTRREFDGNAATFRALDRNRDGRLSRREFVS